MAWNTFTHRRAAMVGKRLLSLALLIAGGVAVPAYPAAAAGGTSYYLDATTGSDANAGTGPAAPWKSLAKLNATTFHAGDQVLLKAGQVWSGQLWPKGSGAAGSPIVLSSYGSGSRPRIDGAGRVTSTVKLHD